CARVRESRVRKTRCAHTTCARELSRSDSSFCARPPQHRGRVPSIDSGNSLIDLLRRADNFAARLLLFREVASASVCRRADFYARLSTLAPRAAKLNFLP